ncbi:molybdopterin adenylyltransferase, partial [Rhizobium straminoryzae]
MHIAIVTISDRASRGEYEDLGGPAIAAWLKSVVVSDYTLIREDIQPRT